VRHLIVALLAACTSKTPAPCERGAGVEIRLVDNDAPYMKEAFAKVNPDPSGTSQDPDALAAGIRAEVDMWRKNIGENELPVERQVDYYLLGTDRAALVAYLDRLPKLDDRELRIERVPGGFRTYFVVKQPILETKHIADVRARDEYVDVVLTAEGKALLATATADAAKVGRKIATLVDGEVFGAPVVNGAIAGGRFTIRAPDPAALAKRLACVTASSR
jgi:hypothetical protein